MTRYLSYVLPCYYPAHDRIVSYSHINQIIKSKFYRKEKNNDKSSLVSPIIMKQYGRKPFFVKQYFFVLSIKPIVAVKSVHITIKLYTFL